MKKHQIHHIVGNVILIQVTHPVAGPGEEEIRKSEIVRFVQLYLDENFSPEQINNDKPPADSDWRLRLHPPTDISRIIMFPPAEESEPFSLVPLKLKGHIKEDRTPNDVLNLLNDAYTELGGSFIDPELDGEERFKTISLDKNDPEFPFRLKSISPDWLASDLHHGGATGGPGSLPARKPAPTGTQQRFQLKGNNALNGLLSFRRPGAEVAILDTIRPLTEFPSHLNAIFTNMDVIRHIHRDDLDEEVWNSLGSYTQAPYHYLMPDHGPFIASIVRFISPSVKIRLYEALTQFGIGSFVSIAQGVLDAVNQRSDSNIPLVINCSFMLDHNISDLTTKMKTLREPDNITLLEMSMKDVFDWATDKNPNITVVASAGNAAQTFPRYPAAFEHVLSVAALPKGNPKDSAGNYERATYSNRAHSNSSSKDRAYSFATFGGGLVQGSLSPTGGILGVYIGVFPTQDADGTFSQNGSGNPTGYGQWSGTSFATPVITGLIVAQNNELVTIATTTVPALPQTDIGENAILVQQGP